MTTLDETRTPGTAAPASARDTLSAYVSLTKPRIIRLLLITTVPTMILAADGMPALGLIIATLIGGTLAAGSANAINCWADRDIDQLMLRTAHRPLAKQQVSPRNALIFGIVLGVVAALGLWLSVNLLSAALAVGAILFYVFVYTLGLKRRTSQNIVIGGAAGAFPALIGWSAVTGTLAAPAWILFGIVFAWTPPHFWALATRYKEDYARAGVPMLPVVASERSTNVQILAYAVVLACVTVMLGPVAGLGVVYLVSLVLLNGWFLWVSVRLLFNPGPAQAMRVFHASIFYLGLLFTAIAVDVLVS